MGRLVEHLDDLEDLYLAESRFKDFQAGGSQVFTLEEVEAHLGLAD
jgi:RHH-type rel operon transcriptional repressor/antitoxin RelB